MAWKENKYIALLICYAIIFVLIMFGMPRQIDWTISYSELHKSPYGCYVLKQELAQLLKVDSDLVNSDIPAFNRLGEVSSPDKSYIAINESLEGMDELDCNALLDYVALGNQAFLSTENFPTDLLDSLNIGTLITSFGAIEIENPKSFLVDAEHTFQLNALPYEQWTAQSNLYVNGFNIDSASFPSTVLGTFSTKPNFIGITIGEGTLYLHSFPLVFTNFNILKDDLIQRYVAGCISYLDGEEVIWDEYYKAGRQKYAQSPLSTLLSYESTKWGIYLALIGILLFMVFLAKRNQRIIPVIKPYKNESVAFSNTLGDLYFQTQDHTDLAQKKVKYFKDYVFEKFRISNLQFNQEETITLARKSGHEKDFIFSLFTMIDQVNNRKVISSQFLQSFSNKLHHFYYGE